MSTSLSDYILSFREKKKKIVTELTESVSSGVFSSSLVLESQRAPPKLPKGRKRSSPTRAFEASFLPEMHDEG